MNLQFLNKNEMQKNNAIPVMKMTSFSRILPINNNINPNNVSDNNSSNNNPDALQSSSKKMEWGEPTWFLFHTLAEKVKKDNFNSIYPELLQLIYNVCDNLPCPVCSQHATEYLKSSKFFLIKTKEDLKAFLFIFHNVINKKKNYPLFDFNNLSEKYSAASTKLIIYNFIFHFQKKNKSMKMLANDMHRTRIINLTKSWFSANIINFDE